MTEAMQHFYLSQFTTLSLVINLETHGTIH